jgi:4-amino-4-deoxychorismate lyase
MKNLYQKSMSLLVESIKLQNGKLLNIKFHNERMYRSLFQLFGISQNVDIESFIIIPKLVESGIFKCRVEYDSKIRNIEFIPYTVKEIRSVKLVEDNSVEYSYKYAERSKLEKLFSLREEADDIVIIKDGMVTDASSANVVFRDSFGNWVTPSTFLLPGTRRARLLNDGIIKEDTITYRDIGKYTELKLINAMIGLDDTEGIPVSNIY